MPIVELPGAPSMSPSLRALLHGIIDYAGLFPPAKLSLEQAVHNYAKYRTEPESWMLGRFVCTVEQLRELTAYQDLFAAGQPLSLAVLGPGATGVASFLEGIINVCNALRSVLKIPGGWLQVDVLELRIPAELVGTSTQPIARAEKLKMIREDFLKWVAEMMGDAFAGQLPPQLTTYYEVGQGPARAELFRSVLKRLSEDPVHHEGLKIRCGGEAVPTPEDVADAITACRDAGAPLKFTAGLHHPIRHFDAATKATMHGFLNVFVAGILAHARNLSKEQIEDIVADEDAKAFIIADDGLRWRDFHASVDEIAAARQRLVTSFGSCSFDEPRDDLRALGLLP